jgi:hypothetical protein
MTLEALILAVAEQPEERSTLYAFIDYLVDEEEYTMGQAVRRAARLRRDCRYQRDAKQARPFIQVESSYYIDLREELRERAGIHIEQYVTLDLHAEYTPFVVTEWHADGRAPSELVITTITVHPRTVLKLVELIDFVRESMKDPPRARRTARRLRHRAGGQHSPA